MSKPVSLAMVIIGITVTAFGGFMLMGTEWDFPGKIWLINTFSFMLIPITSIIPGALLVWFGGLFGSLEIPRGWRIFLITLFVLAAIMSLLIAGILFSLNENGFS